MYSKNVERNFPGFIGFMEDTSGSMAENWAGLGISKAQGTTDIMNATIYEMSGVCSKPDGVRNYFHWSKVTFGQNIEVGFNNQEIVSMKELWDNPIKKEKRKKKESDGVGGVIEVEVDFPIWVEPEANGLTPMREALGRAIEVTKKFIADHPDSYPPMWILVSDGAPTNLSGGIDDFDQILALANQLKELKTSDGNVLLFCGHVSSVVANTILFPKTPEGLDQYGQLLFKMASVLPESMVKLGQNSGYPLENGSVGMIVRGDFGALKALIDIGTKSMADLADSSSSQDA